MLLPPLPNSIVRNTCPFNPRQLFAPAKGAVLAATHSTGDDQRRPRVQRVQADRPLALGLARTLGPDLVDDRELR